MKSKIKTGNRWLIKELENKEVNHCYCETLFNIFLKVCCEMKPCWNQEWNTWAKKILGFFDDFGQDLCEIGAESKRDPAHRPFRLCKRHRHDHRKSVHMIDFIGVFIIGRNHFFSAVYRELT
jgi:hypothetical protein